MKIKFSILSYHPISLTNINVEFIHVGILFYNTVTNEKRLELTKNWKRIETFDDEINLNLFKSVLKGMKNKVEKSIDFQFDRYIKKYINQLQFSDITSVDEDNFELFIENTKKMFLRYDFEKNKRITSTEQLAYIRKLFKSTNIKFENSKITGTFEEKIKFDYYIDNIGFKIFIFTNKDLNKLIFSAKSWAFTALELKENLGINTVFIYDSEIDNSQFKILYKILSKNALKVMDVTSAVNFIKKEFNKQQNFNFFDND